MHVISWGSPRRLRAAASRCPSIQALVAPLLFAAAAWVHAGEVERLSLEESDQRQALSLRFDGEDLVLAPPARADDWTPPCRLATGSALGGVLPRVLAQEPTAVVQWLCEGEPDLRLVGYAPADRSRPIWSLSMPGDWSFEGAANRRLLFHDRRSERPILLDEAGRVTELNIRTAGSGVATMVADTIFHAVGGIERPAQLWQIDAVSGRQTLMVEITAPFLVNPYPYAIEPVGPGHVALLLHVGTRLGSKDVLVIVSVREKAIVYRRTISTSLPSPGKMAGSPGGQLAVRTFKNHTVVLERFKVRAASGR